MRGHLQPTTPSDLRCLPSGPQRPGSHGWHLSEDCRVHQKGLLETHWPPAGTRTVPLASGLIGKQSPAPRLLEQAGFPRSWGLHGTEGRRNCSLIGIMWLLCAVSVPQAPVNLVLQTSQQPCDTHENTPFFCR